ncbi:hypothetical protein PRIPAC_82251 [Pristionchus pacificus]|uniref:Uncharacterized protein n=1 Tax=Pristionchus pacificus TaxID=54126 RepID=A0A454XMT3_PRIPA|nr:hypothetical protein PRIPAC_82251 [Pristionchus pacificus]|eukprot:PDM72889.1 hypothetical protein PRIPAC_39323 [Pristionchus pacificus]
MKIFLLTVIFSFSSAAKDKSVGAQGQLKCGTAPLPLTEVTLWAEGGESDGVVAKAKTDEFGNFRLSGSGDSSGMGKPEVRVSHQCSESGVVSQTECPRNVSFAIPASFVSDGSKNYYWFKLGTRNLATKQPNEQQANCTMVSTTPANPETPESP